MILQSHEAAALSNQLDSQLAHKGPVVEAKVYAGLFDSCIAASVGILTDPTMAVENTAP